MLVTFKTLAQKTLKLEIDPEEKVIEMKNKLRESFPEFAVDRVKLIYLGQVLDNEKMVKEYQVSEKGFVVIMVSKAPDTSTQTTMKPVVDEVKSENKDKTGDSSCEPEPVAERATCSDFEVGELQAEGSTNAATVESVDQLSNVPASDSSMLFGQELEDAIEEMMLMGFEKDHVLQALQASFNNPDRAVEYLISGGIPNIQQSATADIPVTPTETAVPPEQSVDIDADINSNPIEYLRRLPQFQQMREVIRQNPNSLGSLLHDLGQQNPQVLDLIRTHQTEFLAALNSDLFAEGDETHATGGTEPAHIRLTTEEIQAVDRIVSMGFDRNLVFRAYVACDKNEEAAVNFLLNEQMEED